MWLEMYGTNEKYFEALSSLMEKNVQFPENMEEYDVNLAVEGNSPPIGGSRVEQPTPKPDFNTPTYKPIPVNQPEHTPKPKPGNVSVREEISALKGLREVLTDVILGNDSFPSCKIPS